MLSDKEKLEEELRFLEDSFNIGVITKEEYETGKERVESKLKESEQKEEAEEDIEVKEIKPEDTEIKPADKEVPEATVEEKQEEVKEDIEVEEVVEKKEEVVETRKEAPKAEILTEDPEEEVKKEESKSVVLETEEVKKEDIPVTLETEEEKTETIPEPKTEEETKKVEDKLATLKTEEGKTEAIPEPKTEEEPQKKEEKVEEIPAEKDAVEETPTEKVSEEPKEVDEEDVVSTKLVVSILIIFVIGLGSWFFFFSGDDDYIDADHVGSGFTTGVDEIEFKAVCSSDKECNEQKGKIGICSNPGKENAECNYIDDVRLNLKVINSDACFNCKTGRILKILNTFYPNIAVKTIELESDEGKELVEKFNIEVMPAYIFESNFKEAYDYEKLSGAFKQKEGNFVMKNTVSYANYYFEREEVSNKLDLFFQEGQEASVKAEDNLKEFLDAFGKNVVFEKHDSNSQIVKELGIITFPTFLINNNIKFSGVQPADKIRENFCQVNFATQCGSGFSKSLV